ncbi:MAG TPA: hypothetical protein VN228_19720 [Pyrinomonadaceae bacterium]|nr:hypothetical protein [Pyrinomonadaceae bacterium]
MTRKALLVAPLLALAAAVWVWWSRPERVDMAAYVPADSVVYLEANSLTEIVGGLASTEAWREFAPAAGVEKGWGEAGWLGRLAALTGVGSGEAVVLSRAQVAVAVLGFKAEEESETAITFAPRVALVAETHTGDWRARPAVEKLIGDFARRSFGEPRVLRTEFDGVPAVVWEEPGETPRRVFAAVRGGVAVVGNDENVVRACLDVRRGARQSLAGNAQLEEMRARLDAGGALAFGFAPQGSAAKAVEALAPAFVGGVSEESRVQSMLATLLPKLSDRLVRGVGWSSRVAGGRVEDRYLLTPPEGVAERLRAPLAAADSPAREAAALLPRDTHQVTFYNLRNPEFAWRGLSAAVSSQVDVSSAALVTLGLESMLEPYGVENPREFLRAVGSEVLTARLDEGGEGRVLIAEALDREALRAQALKRLGAGTRPQQLGDAELFVSADSGEEGAAAFVGRHLILGGAADVRRCLAARQEGRTLRQVEGFERLAAPSSPPALAQTLTDERESIHAVLASLSRRDPPPARPARPFYSVTETRLAETGFERKTLSAFGQFGEVIARINRR